MPAEWLCGSWYLLGVQLLRLLSYEALKVLAVQGSSLTWLRVYAAFQCLLSWGCQLESLYIFSCVISYLSHGGWLSTGWVLRVIILSNPNIVCESSMAPLWKCCTIICTALSWLTSSSKRVIQDEKIRNGLG